jgi:hypothetical protein
LQGKEQKAQVRLNSDIYPGRRNEANSSAAGPQKSTLAGALSCKQFQ